ncbi:MULTISPECIES: MalY/PatB family protein [unclassified Arthrobacter]|uniref:MalY/PatB family protein n=1 Tax=unclassified Arthrobacter TaxID=235627 RepID=UPI001D1415A0|nr:MULTISPECIES: aminotransferase class I/II-fold pyridoxal phosphate-dependent enzyme [unclassified Arthrobacter]MCC3276133.1 aminotransferase class I/II-fold pyridoxal phosphate-dependent enzyme [Arthrobacter sp. zg-Y20]MCC9176281.1 aminotransferase class I/II-fold pyridoxal phosphate-dependent enzyme [Arthrobacter sp. zg-Y750]MDK1316293.1 aminotransferase class I/II-fold pyridoxal phosphate-dependent enzyme [Arthrobacter sp. zg.Y20]WIB05429.1 aminotransferase class I/II-fold pyridoxal phosph
MTKISAEPLAALRERTSWKWQTYPQDVLPLFVAEMDYPLAKPVQQAVIDRVLASDTGYIAGPGMVAQAFAGFAARTWGWTVEPGDVRCTTDVSVAIVECLRQTVPVDGSVVITPPVYPPFFELPVEADASVVEVPLLPSAEGWTLDLANIERAFARGADALLLCNPHNPLGLVHSAGTLRALADLSAKYGVAVISDEIHAPLTYSPDSFTPYLTVSDNAREFGICVTAASKAWNIAGTKCAVMAAASERTRLQLDSMPAEVSARTSILGLHATTAAYNDGGPWLAGVMESLAENRILLGELLAEHLPGVGYRAPSAGYLAWLDFGAAGWGDDPAAFALDHARVALEPGLRFGRQGAGFARLNFACSSEVLTEAVSRLAASAALR